MRRMADAAWFTPVTRPDELAVKIAETLPMTDMVLPSS
jgi:hypothetical protein